MMFRANFDVTIQHMSCQRDALRETIDLLTQHASLATGHLAVPVTTEQNSLQQILLPLLRQKGRDRARPIAELGATRSPSADLRTA